MRHCLRAHSATPETTWAEWTAAENAEMVALDPRGISRFRAACLLRDCQTWPRDAFFEAWADALPANVEPLPADLEGLALIIDEKGLQAISA